MSKFYLSWDRVEISTFLIKIENKSREKREHFRRTHHRESPLALRWGTHWTSIVYLAVCLSLYPLTYTFWVCLFRSLAGEGCCFVPGCCTCVNTTPEQILLSPWQHPSSCGSPVSISSVSTFALAFLALFVFFLLRFVSREWAQISTMLGEITGL